MLMNFEEEVGYVLVTIGHSFQPLDFVVDTFGDSRSDPHLEIVQDVVPFAEELQPQFDKCRNSGGKGFTDPLSEACLRGLSGTGTIDLEKLLLEQHGAVDCVVKLSELVENSALPL